MTKFFVKSTLGAVSLALLLGGCFGGEPEKPAEPAKPAEPSFACKQEGQLAPKWTCNPFADGYIAALGVAKANAGSDISFQRTEAMGNARDALSRQIEVKVKNMYKSFKSSTTAAGGTFDKTTEDVSKQISNQTLNGTRSVDSWTSQKGTMYLLVVVDTKSVSSLMEEASKSAYKNDQAAYQRFMAAKAQGELDAELAK